MGLLVKPWPDHASLGLVPPLSQNRGRSFHIWAPKGDRPARSPGRVSAYTPTPSLSLRSCFPDGVTPGGVPSEDRRGPIQQDSGPDPHKVGWVPMGSGTDHPPPAISISPDPSTSFWLCAPLLHPPPPPPTHTLFLGHFLCLMLILPSFLIPPFPPFPISLSPPPFLLER